jgi:hypothetical protein
MECCLFTKEPHVVVQQSTSCGAPNGSESAKPWNSSPPRSPSFRIMPVVITCCTVLWDVGFGTRRNNNVNFYNRYLLLLEEEHTDEYASRVYGNWRRAITLRRSSGSSGLACTSDGRLPCVGSWVTASRP